MRQITIEYREGESTTLLMEELGGRKLEHGDIVKTYDQHPDEITGVYVITRYERDHHKYTNRSWSICDGCVFSPSNGCIQVAVDEYQDPECAAGYGCVFKSIDSIMESL